jgi:hypothetical protein
MVGEPTCDSGRVSIAEVEKMVARMVFMSEGVRGGSGWCAREVALSVVGRSSSG